MIDGIVRKGEKVNKIFVEDCAYTWAVHNLLVFAIRLLYAGHCVYNATFLFFLGGGEGGVWFTAGRAVRAAQGPWASLFERRLGLELSEIHFPISSDDWYS